MWPTDKYIIAGRGQCLSQTNCVLAVTYLFYCLNYRSTVIHLTLTTFRLRVSFRKCLISALQSIICGIPITDTDVKKKKKKVDYHRRVPQISQQMVDNFIHNYTLYICNQFIWCCTEMIPWGSQ